ncbi:MAG: hypothetical protein ACI9BD_001594 [Candidatus Marinamargulisbacteria bacterium]|jgi:hypothetical protein
MDELRTVGLDYVDDEGNVYKFSNTDLNPITENQFRRQLAIFKTEEVIILRPSYAKIHGQQTLDSHSIHNHHHHH